MQAQPCSSMPDQRGKGMNSTERRQLQRLAKRARDQRNATTDNESFDYWQGVMENLLNQLKTGDTK
jgi:very-short-patch-repair endonuclease